MGIEEYVEEDGPHSIIATDTNNTAREVHNTSNRPRSAAPEDVAVAAVVDVLEFTAAVADDAAGDDFDGDLSLTGADEDKGGAVTVLFLVCC